MAKKKNKKVEGFRPKEKSPYMVIKVPLKSVIRDRFNVKGNIDDLVIKINDLIIQAYQFIKLYILDYYNTERNVVVGKFMDLPYTVKGHTVPIIDKELITYCFKCLYGKSTTGGARSGNIQRMDEIRNFYEKHYKHLTDEVNKNIDRPILDNIKQILDYQIDKILTGLRVNIEQHFVQHFRKFMNKTVRYQDKDKFIKFKDSMFTLNPVLGPEFRGWYDLHIKNIIPWNMRESVHYDLKVQPFAYLNGLIYMNKILEENGHKLFQPIPLRTNIIPKNILIDTITLIKYFMPKYDEMGNRIVKKEWVDNLTDNYRNIWNIFFKRNNKVFRDRHYAFNNQIETDGFSCSLCFIRRDLYGTPVYGRNSMKNIKPEDSDGYFRLIDEFSKEDLDKMKRRPIVGCDPGKYILGYFTDGKKNVKYTVNQRDKEKKVTRGKEIMEKEKKKHKIQEFEAVLSQYNSNTVDVNKFKEYIKAKLTVNLQTRKFYNNILWRKLRFRQYAYGQASIAKLVNKLEDTFGKDLVIGYGNWSLHANNNIKGCKPSMNIGLRREIHKRLDTVSINEDYTSQKCSTCSCQLEYYLKDKDGYDVKRLQVCRSPFCNRVKGINVGKYYRGTTKHLIFKTRDRNSAENIRNITMAYIYNRERPTQFRRKADCSSSPAIETNTLSI